MTCINNEKNICRPSFNSLVTQIFIQFHSCLFLCSHFTLLYIAISKNVVRENDECQLSNGNCTTEKKCEY